MKISLDRLKKEGKIQLEYEDDQFQVPHIGKNDREISVGPLKITFTLRLLKNNLQIVGNILGSFKLICDRCAEEYIENKNIKVDEIFELEEEEIKSRVVELDNKVYDIVITSFPMQNLCKPDCKGICLGCKVNLNKEECKCSR